jgi:hypothetical protein
LQHFTQAVTHQPALGNLAVVDADNLKQLGIYKSSGGRHSRELTTVMTVHSNPGRDPIIFRDNVLQDGFKVWERVVQH